MNTLLRAASSSIRPRFDHYEPLNNEAGHEEDGANRWRTFSKRKREISTQNGANMMTNSMSYRSVRARKRLIFLKSYKLGSVKRPATSSPSQKVKKALSKVKALVISAVALARIGLIRSGNCRSAIDASVPVRKVGFRG